MAISEELKQVGYDAVRNRVFSKDDIINAFLRAGVAVENVDARAQEWIDEAMTADNIRPLTNKPGKFSRRV